MAKKPTNKVPWIVIGCVLLAMAPCGFCLYGFIPRITRDPPVTVAEEKDRTGRVVRRVVRETVRTKYGPGLGPHGPIREIGDYTDKYFLEEPGKPQRYLSFLEENQRFKYGQSPSYLSSKLNCGWLRCRWQGSFSSTSLMTTGCSAGATFPATSTTARSRFRGQGWQSHTRVPDHNRKGGVRCSSGYSDALAAGPAPAG
jgi:hypothetical protein